MLEKFKEWLDVEIKELARYPENNMLWAKQAEAIRIREMYRQCEEVESTIEKQKITAVADRICLKFCRFPEVYDDKERMAKEHCKECPLSELVK